MLIASRQRRNNLTNANLTQYNDIDINLTTCDNILGINVDNNITWNNNFNFLSTKLASYMWLLSKIRSYLST